jgi:hypothetical protein
MAVSFSKDIAPIFNQFRGQMMWRFDLTNYEHVKANASVIHRRLSQADIYGPMPPPPLDPLTSDQIQLFEQWISDGYMP